jgi:hypothetical protein
MVEAIKILPETGRWREATEGQLRNEWLTRRAELPLHHSSVVPLPVPGRI